MANYDDIIKGERFYFEGDEKVKISSCVMSGFCCIQVPCGFGEWNKDKTHCLHLSEPNEIGQRFCGKYDWIKENVPDYQYYPAFGSGCGSTIFNRLRKSIIEKLPDDIRKQIT